MGSPPRPPRLRPAPWPPFVPFQHHHRRRRRLHRLPAWGEAVCCVWVVAGFECPYQQHHQSSPTTQRTASSSSLHSKATPFFPSCTPTMPHAPTQTSTAHLLTGTTPSRGPGCVNSVRAADLDGHAWLHEEADLPRVASAANDGMECIGPATTFFLVCCTLIPTSPPRTPTQALRRCRRRRPTPSGRRLFLLLRSVYSSLPPSCYHYYPPPPSSVHAAKPKASPPSHPITLSQCR